MDFPYQRLQETELKGKRVFVRVDFNVPLKGEPDAREVADSTRIIGALPSIRYIREQGGICILASHLGRPNGKPNKEYSLEPVGAKLSDLLRTEVILTEDCIGDGPRGLGHQAKLGDILLLENLRFHSGEEENSVDFVVRLAELCDVYVSDAFGTLHRAHASTFGLPKMMRDRCVGFLVQKELDYLQPLRDNPQRPFVLVMGGAKVSDKMGVIEHFLSKVDAILVGGAMAYSFLKAQNKEIGKSLCDDKQVTLAAKLLKSAMARNVKIILPVDHLVTDKFENIAGASMTSNDQIPPTKMAVDIGPKTLNAFSKALRGAETIFWNGPMGVFEVPAFSQGTSELARRIGALPARKLAGGGDVVAAIAKAGCESQFDFVSTGGGATLEYLEGKDLPGLKALEL